MVTDDGEYTTLLSSSWTCMARRYSASLDEKRSQGSNRNAFSDGHLDQNPTSFNTHAGHGGIRSSLS
jgi:hypothetical protein